MKITIKSRNTANSTDWSDYIKDLKITDKRCEGISEIYPHLGGKRVYKYNFMIFDTLEAAYVWKLKDKAVFRKI